MSVLLKTVRAVIYNVAEATQRLEVCVLFDSGSQQS